MVSQNSGNNNSNNNNNSGNTHAGNIIQILASLPDFLRKPMLQSRLKEFYSMDDVTKRETISMALAAAPTIDPHKLGVLFKTWLELLSGLEPEKRATMFRTYCEQILAQPESAAKVDFRGLTDIFSSLPEKQRELLKDSLHEVLFAMPNREAILRLVPDYSLKVLKLK